MAVGKSTPSSQDHPILAYGNRAYYDTIDVYTVIIVVYLVYVFLASTLN